jgi:hypothetical protein
MTTTVALKTLYGDGGFFRFYRCVGVKDEGGRPRLSGSLRLRLWSGPQAGVPQ